jgi:hypothetical protein
MSVAGGGRNWKGAAARMAGRSPKTPMFQDHEAPTAPKVPNSSFGVDLPKYHDATIGVR